jgi:putative acetyltransferase
MTLHFRDAAPGDEPAVRAVVYSTLREYGLAPDPATIDADLEDIARSYLDRGGAFRVLVSPAGEIVGCGGLYPLDDEEAEIRKMYLRPEARGQGLGRVLFRDLLQHARERRFERVVLETASVLKEAIALYRSHGFVPVRRAHMARRCDQAYVLDLTRPPAAAGRARSKPEP